VQSSFSWKVSSYRALDFGPTTRGIGLCIDVGQLRVYEPALLIEHVEEA
jgi:hypothetical protein